MNAELDLPQMRPWEDLKYSSLVHDPVEVISEINGEIVTYDNEYGVITTIYPSGREI